nr:coat protein [Partitiviridae sp.]
MEQGDRIPPADAVMAPAQAPPRPQGIQPALLRTATDFLVQRERITMQRSHYIAYRRYAQLEAQNMYDELVDMYAMVFNTYWQKFRRFMDHFPPPQHVQPSTHAARAYISAWFIDLYVMNRNAVQRTSSIAFCQRYATELLPMLTEYDAYLSTLSSSIRPTQIRGALEDTLYIPYISDEITLPANNNEALNPFELDHFVHNAELCTGLRDLMKECRIFKMAELAQNTMGRPCWLFDWHNNNTVAAWFPSEGNFNLDDVSLAYIIGVACTPKMGPRDVDDWRLHQGRLPNRLTPADYHRVVPRRWYGGYEVATIEGEEIDQEEAPAGPPNQQQLAKKRKAAKGKKAATTSTNDEPTDESQDVEEGQIIAGPASRTRLTNWTYYYELVLNLEQHTRTGALRKMIINSA